MPAVHPWPQYQKDGAFTGHSSVPLDCNGVLKWTKFLDASGTRAQPIIGQVIAYTYYDAEGKKTAYRDQILIPTKDFFYGVDSADGSIDFSTAITRTPTVGEIEWNIDNVLFPPTSAFITDDFVFFNIGMQDSLYPGGGLMGRLSYIFNLSDGSFYGMGGYETVGAGTEEGSPCPPEARVLFSECSTNGSYPATYIHYFYYLEPGKTGPYRIQWTSCRNSLWYIDLGYTPPIPTCPNAEVVSLLYLPTPPFGSVADWKGKYLGAMLDDTDPSKSHFRSYNQGSDTLIFEALDIDCVQNTPSIITIGSDDIIYLGTRGNYLKSWYTDGTLRFSDNIGRSIANGLAVKSITVDDQTDPGEEITMALVYFTTTDGYIYSRPDDTVKCPPEYNWNQSFSESNPTTPVICGDYVLFCAGRKLFCYSYQGVKTLEIPVLDSEAAAPPSIDTYGNIYVMTQGGYLYCFNNIAPTFDVIKTTPADEDTDIETNTTITIVFTSVPKSSTVTTQNVKVEYSYKGTEYEAYYSFEIVNSTLTLTLSNELPSNTEVTVTLGTGLTNASDIGLSTGTYSWKFTTEAKQLSDYVTSCEVLGPNQTFSEYTQITILCPTPAYQFAQWRLHFKIESYKDIAKLNLIASKDTLTQPEDFEYSPDDGITWYIFPADGLPPERYGCKIRVTLNTGRDNTSSANRYIQAYVGAEDV